MTWQEVVASQPWRDAVAAARRTVSYRVEVVGVDGSSVGPLPVDGVRISYDGDQAQAWQATVTVSDPALVPVSTVSALDGRSGLRLRVWWRLLTSAGWLECPVGTFVPEDPRVSDSGAPVVTVSGLDPLAVARRGGYGSRVIPVGGMTVSAALARLFAVLVPGYPVAIDASTQTLPAQYDLWDREPAEDWAEIAAMAGMVVRTDRMGVITVSRQPDPQTVAVDWQEGPACPVTELSVDHRTSTIPRRVVVVSTSPDVSPPVVGTWVNPSADSISVVTETRIESSVVTTVEAATAMATMHGQRWAAPQQSVEVTVPSRPDLSYRDLVSLSRLRSGVAGVYRVAGWDLELRGPDQAPPPMRVRMLTRGGE